MSKCVKYIERNDLTGATHLEVMVYYTKGGGTIRRGYYISLKPVTKYNGTISYVMYTGRRQLLLETSRYSDKQFAQAVEMAREFEDELIAAVVEENMAA